MAAIACLTIDAFADRPFAGNPAAVCLLESAADAAWMQRVAAEMNLSETAFLHPRSNGFGLRWFTPAAEVDLCGHATLAAAHALWSEGLVDPDVVIPFHTKSGVLACRRDGEWIELDFPATPAQPVDTPPAGLLEALGVAPSFVGRTVFDQFVVTASEDTVRSLTPDFVRLRALNVRGVIVTAPSADAQFDFVSRYFAPAVGIDEDPVTGSAHCALARYWSERLGKTSLVGYQASGRGGVVRTQLVGDRVLLGGQAVTVMRGSLSHDVARGA
jgi:PhzF family phenazine biosynthesis protein